MHCPLRALFASSGIVGMSVNVANQCNSRNNYRDVYYKRTGSLLNELKFQEEFFIARDCSLMQEAENLANIQSSVLYRIALWLFFDFRIPREDEAITTRIQSYGAV